jgi:hypothetical protein
MIMTTRVTEAQLEAIVKRINVATGSPLEPYVNRVAQIGCYHLSGAYGGVSLHRMTCTSGGIKDVFNCGHITKRELADRMYAFLDGFDAAQTK